MENALSNSVPCLQVTSPSCNMLQHLPASLWSPCLVIAWGSVPQSWASCTLKTKFLLGRPLFLFIWLFIDSISIFPLPTLCLAQWTYDSEEGSMADALPKPTALSDAGVQSSEKRDCLKYFLEVMINCCMTVGKLSYSTTLMFVCSEAGFSGPLRIIAFQSWEALTVQLPHFTDEETGPQKWHALPADIWTARSKPPSDPIACHNEAEDGLFFRKNWETFKGSAFHPELFREMAVQNAQAAANVARTKVIFGSHQRVSTTQRPGNEKSRGPATRNLPLEPRACLLINLPWPFWSWSAAPSQNDFLITRIPFGNYSCVCKGLGTQRALVWLVGWWFG